jgi:hypothetical protein
VNVIAVIVDFNMSHLWDEPKEIHVSVDASGRPRWFVWHGRKHGVSVVGQPEIVEADWWSEAGEVRRQYIPIVTDTGLKCDIYFDFLTESWWMASVYD